MNSPVAISYRGHFILLVHHIFKKLGMTRSQALEHYLAVVKQAFDAGIRPRCHLEDITRADFYGFVVPFVNELTELSKESGIPIKVRMCDTMGYGVPYPGVALPRSVPGIVYGLHHYSDVTSEMLEWHGHNDFYKGVVNGVAAWLYGASAVNCSLLGIGERTGNIPLEAMVIEYASLRGTFDGMDPTVITEIADYYRHELHYDIPPMTPFVGENFNVTKAGIHADGLMKDAEIYNIFNTEKILNRPAEVAISNTSGLAGIAYWINTYYGRSNGDKAGRAHRRYEKRNRRPVHGWENHGHERGGASAHHRQTGARTLCAQIILKSFYRGLIK